MPAPVRQFVQRDVHLQRGGVLAVVSTAYTTYGNLEPDGRNAVLVLHGYTSGPNMVEPDAQLAEGSWSEIVGPGKPIDTRRYFVVCPNALGSSYGSTNAASIDPATGHPFGSRFPEITVSDIVAGQKALLDRLGVRRLVTVIGPSFGGAQALQWGVDFPDCMASVVAVLTGLRMPNANPEKLKAELAGSPHWHGGDYYGRGDMVSQMTVMRVRKLSIFGIEAVLARTTSDAEERLRALHAIAADWARGFDANSMLILSKAMASFDVTEKLDRIRCPVLFALSRTDRVFPPSSALEVMKRFRQAGVEARYYEIDSDFGHSASGAEPEKWAPELRALLADVVMKERISA